MCLNYLLLAIYEKKHCTLLTSIDTVVRPSLTNLFCFRLTLTILAYAELLVLVRRRSDDSMPVLSLRRFSYIYTYISTNVDLMFT